MQREFAQPFAQCARRDEHRAFDVPTPECQAGVDVDELHPRFVEVTGKLIRLDPARALAVRPDPARFGAGVEGCGGKCGARCIVEHANIEITKLLQPRRGHAGAYAVVVAQHDACMQRADVFVRGLHELTSGRRAPACRVAGFVFQRVAHIEAIQRALRAFLVERGEFLQIDERNLGALRRRAGQFTCGGERVRVRTRRDSMAHDARGQAVAIRQGGSGMFSPLMNAAAQRTANRQAP
ncbi:hypothetical protein QCE88_26980 [Caballeronia sp. LZ035]|nr:hypothetical protein [Caballeronia sp. LZ035]MDR5760630.1 hypothetical protein [Caballeronia sp. LZ035]